MHHSIPNNEERRMSYAQRKNKHYKHKFTNAHQTPQKRRNKYHIAKTLTHNTKLAQQLRDIKYTLFYTYIANYLNLNGGH